MLLVLAAALAGGCRSTDTPQPPASGDASSTPPSTLLAGAPSGPLVSGAPPLAPGESYAVVLAGRRSIPAGAKVVEHLAFESTSVALFGAYAPSGALSVQIGSTGLAETALVRGSSSWSVTLEKPADADLTISNLSASAVDVDVLVLVATKRVLTVSTPATSVAGHSLPVHVALTEAVRGDTPKAFFIDEEGTQAPIPLSAAGPGSWSGTTAPPRGGSYRVLATVAGDRPRSAVDFLVATSGTARLGESFEESLLGNEDGLADGLRLTIPVTTSGEGTIALVGDLVESTGAFIARAHTRMTPTGSGSVSISLDFDGAAIKDAGRSGRYRLIDVKLFRPDLLAIEDETADMGLTSESYDAAKFEARTP